MTKFYLAEVLNAVYPQTWVRVLDRNNKEIAFQHAKALIEYVYDKIPADVEIIGVRVEDYILDLTVDCCIDCPCRKGEF